MLWTVSTRRREEDDGKCRGSSVDGFAFLDIGKFIICELARVIVSPQMPHSLRGALNGVRRCEVVN